MLFSKTLTALAFAAFAAATPVKRADSTTCYFIMTPTTEPTELQSSINYAVGRTVAINWTGKQVNDVNDPPFRHDDGTYDVRSVISVEGVAAADVASFVNTWAHTTITGFHNDWYVNAANCV